MVSFCRLKVTFQGGLVEKRFVPAPSGAGELPRIWSTIMTQHAAFYWKQTNYWKKINKKNRITNHKNTNRKKTERIKLHQSALFLFLFCFFVFIFLVRLRNPKSAFFPWKKSNNKQKETTKKQIAAGCFAYSCFVSVW
jgi:hypothetical protein